jgi:hypothetical protein
VYTSSASTPDLPRQANNGQGAQPGGLAFCATAPPARRRTMSTNEGSTDRIIRVVLGVAMLALGWLGVVDGWLGTTLQWLGFVPLITGLVGWCPLYSIFGMRTNGKAQAGQA